MCCVQELYNTKWASARHARCKETSRQVMNIVQCTWVCERAARHDLDWKSCCMYCLGLSKVASHSICLVLGLTCTICTLFLPLVHLWARPLDYWSLQSDLVADLPIFSQRQDLKGQWRWQVGLCKAKIHKKINTEGNINKVVCEKPQEFDDCHKTEEQILFSKILKDWWFNFPDDTFFMLLSVNIFYMVYFTIF